MVEYQRQRPIIGKRFKLIDPSDSEFAVPLPRKISCLKVPSHNNSSLFLEREENKTNIGRQI